MAKREPWNPLLCSYPDSKKVNSVSFEAETLFTRLIAKCDDAANFDGNSTLILCKIFAERKKNGQVSERKIKKWLEELVKVGLIVKYSVNDEEYIHIKNCKKHIRKDLKADIRFPAYQPKNSDKQEKPASKNVTDSGRTRNENRTEIGTSTTSTTTTTDNIHTHKRDGCDESRNENGGFTLEQVKDAAVMVGLTPDKAEMFFHHFNAQGWVRTNGQKITNLASALTYWRNHQFEFEKGKSNEPKKRTNGNRPSLNEQDWGQDLIPN